MGCFLDQMRLGPRRILVTGHFGSGKTEFAVSLAFALSKTEIKESKLALADVDIENPYFRSRERQDELNAAGVSVYSDPFGGRNGSELQVIDPAILAPVQNPDCRIIIDTGGDKSGAMILNQFSRHFNDEYQLLSVVNCNRPGTDTVEKAVEQLKSVEAVTGLNVSGIVSNAHLITYTTKEDVMNGFVFSKAVSEAAGVPLLAVCAMDKIAKEIKVSPDYQSILDSGADVFPIGMYMRDSYLDKRV